MPSTYAHYRLGQQVRRELEGNERKIIEKYPQLYLIGLHGPDILFYYKPLRPNPVNQIGYAWGYAGSCIPFVVCLVFVLGYQKMGLSFETGMMIAFAVVAVWWLGFHRTASCIACDTVCCISVFHSVWQACGKIRYRKADFNLYCCVYGDYHFCRVYEGTVAVLGAGNLCGNVPGGHSGTVPVLFCKNCSAGAFRRVFWSDGYLWKRSILYGNDGGRTGFPGFWEYKHRGIRYRISFPCRSTVFYENRAQWIGKYEKSGEHCHGTADVP